MDHDLSETTRGDLPGVAPGDTVDESSRRIVLVTGWLLVLLGTNVPRIVTTELFAADASWIAPAQIVATCGLLLLSVLDRRFRPLQAMALALLAVKVTRVVSVVEVLDFVGVSLPQGTSSIASLFFRGSLALVLLGVLLIRGERRESLFLQRSDLSVDADPEWVPGFRSGWSWSRLGAFHCGLAVLTTALFLVLAGANFAFWAVPAGELLVLAVIVTVAASVNAFTEEFVFRAAPLADLADVLDKSQAMLLLAAFFGLSHFYGTPGGVPGVLMTLFLGWWLTKSLLETRGMTVAWTVHFLLDFVILWAWVLT